ncbi:hypothetical protein J5N97_017784 [Dioscorea zingiberensis]|uniref:Small auxin up regulated protein n=1 Tax=Dioscorea zingiberensis TaxID=325984 RepID=A0A9D5CN43_9LILI|nr:hypothetical protein J5N97_017784 [Dioscorea zingiberensis]
MMRIWKKNNQAMEKSGGMKREDVRATPKGFVPVIIGDRNGCSERRLVRVELLRDQRMVELLELAAQEFGYDQQGVLRIPCDPDYFRQVITHKHHEQIER